ncbi:hypothetical protein ABZX85_43820 [Streptomyces sp. NPDC004539]|uniref:hypothetical protein n=1 Tax=Streptomyces sp. NPDC004539 TaxID=3154280 RepID=UPI0033A5235A
MRELPTPLPGMRLLPWTTPEGNPCHLSTDNPHSRLSLLADDIEDAHLTNSQDVLAGAKEVLADDRAGERAVRFALGRATECLADVLLVAVSRGARISSDG